MSLYEIVITCVALVNVVITLTVLRANAAKAATAQLEAIERELRDQIQEHESQLSRLHVNSENAITHEHLSDVYADLKGIAQQVNMLVGQQMQMNENLRLLLQRMVH
jgi:hypothetical protein